ESSYPNARDQIGWADAVFFRRTDIGKSWQQKFIRSLIALVVYQKPSLAATLAQQLKNTPAEAFRSALFPQF
ncbi:MAG: hypothetical protein ACRC7C_00610, partial [Beijerinckiaceae bacterium]